MSIKIATVKFSDSGKAYYFGVGDLTVNTGDHVIVETSHGLEYGFVEKGNHEIKQSELTGELKSIIRLATDGDTKTREANKAKEDSAFKEAQKKVEKLGLKMKLVDASFAFDGGRITFSFTSDDRVDFRELVKVLASHFHARIELRQIGARDEVRQCKGCFGMCGQQVCCARFLPDYKPVSIKMAKNQNLSLNPTKISGVCGKLLCCLEYENDHYRELNNMMPRVGSSVRTPDGQGAVMYNDLLGKRVTVKISRQDGFDIKQFELDQVKFNSKSNVTSIKDDE